MPADGGVLLAELDQAGGGFDVVLAQGECSAASARGLEVESEEQGVQDGVASAGGDGVGECGDFGGAEGVAGGGSSSGFGDFGGGVVVGWEEVVVDGAVVDGARGGDEVFGDGVAAGVVASDPSVLDQAAHEAFDLCRGDLVQVSFAEGLGDAGPVGAVGAPVPEAATTRGM